MLYWVHKYHTNRHNIDIIYNNRHGERGDNFLIDTANSLTVRSDSDCRQSVL